MNKLFINEVYIFFRHISILKIYIFYKFTKFIKIKVLRFHFFCIFAGKNKKNGQVDTS